MKQILFFSFISFIFFSTPKIYAQDKNEIHITVKNITPVKGQLLIAFYNEKNNFLKVEGTIYNNTYKVVSQTQKVVFNSIKPGKYAIAVIHDVNNNGKLDQNFIKLPTELIGTSNNIKNRFGPPLFDDALFYYKGGILHLTIELY